MEFYLISRQQAVHALPLNGGEIIDALCRTRKFFKSKNPSHAYNIHSNNQQAYYY